MLDMLCKLLCTKQTSTDNPVMFTRTPVGGRGTPATLTTPPGNTDKSAPTPSEPQGASTDHANMPSDGRYLTYVNNIGKSRIKQKAGK